MTFEKRQCPLWKSTTWLLVVIKTIGHQHSWHRKWPGAGRRWWARHRYTKYGTELRAIFLFEKSKTGIHFFSRRKVRPGFMSRTGQWRLLHRKWWDCLKAQMSLERCTNVSAPLALYQAHCNSVPTRHMLTRQVEEHESSLPGRLHSDMPHRSGTCTYQSAWWWGLLCLSDRWHPPAVDKCCMQENSAWIGHRSKHSLSQTLSTLCVL